MGHERVGRLPKSQVWQDVVHEITNLSHGELDVSKLVGMTVFNTRLRFERINQDYGVISAFKFLVALGVSCRSQHPQRVLSSIGIQAPDSPTPLGLARALNLWMLDRSDFIEYREIAKKSSSDAIAQWWLNHRPRQEQLVIGERDPYEAWRGTATGAGFCELSRVYFAKFTEHYLNYYLEREASISLESISKRDQFSAAILTKIDLVSRHSFETARITQSFAAAWFNRHAKNEIPDDEKIKSFLSVAFGKIREDLLREDAE